MNRMTSKWKMAVAAALVAMAAALPVAASAQVEWSQDRACPGWSNPTSFNVSVTDMRDTLFRYRGQAGNVTGTAPNVLTNQTGMNISGVKYNTAAQLNAADNTGLGGCSPQTAGGIPSNTKLYYINRDLTGKDPHTGNVLPYVPTSFNTHDSTPGFINTNIKTSIRIGDDCTGSATVSANALYYELVPRASNALFFLYYAAVVEAPGHGVANDPVFVIRVMRDVNFDRTHPNYDNTHPRWSQGVRGPDWRIISDTLAYYVASTPTSNGGTVQLAPAGQTGWHQYGGGYNAVNYKDWAKVAINLNNYLNEHLRIEVLMSDCGYNAHYAYAYVSGECRQMKIDVAGCPAGIDTTVATLTAPQGMLSYTWYASEWGVSEPSDNFLLGPDEEGNAAHFTWRQVATGTNNAASVYKVKPSDFRVRYRGTAAQSQTCDSIGYKQSFRCVMTSAVDPNKPFKSYLYANATNTKPTVRISMQPTCDGKVALYDDSFVPGLANAVDNNLTKWEYFTRPVVSGEPAETHTGISTDFSTPKAGEYGLRVNAYYRDDLTCFTTYETQITALENPKTGFTLSKDLLCDADETRLVDTTSDATYRVWRFLKYNDASDTTDTVRVVLDSVVGRSASDQRVYERGFENPVNPIELYNRNGLYYLNPANILDTIWCSSLAYDTVAVFLHPELRVTGDTIVCEGSPTDATVTAVGVNNCVYQWSRQLGSITGGIPQGQHLGVVPYADTSKYYVKVTTEQGCVAWDSINAYLVKPQIHMIPADGRICPGDTAILYGTAADHYSWTASPADGSLGGQADKDTIRVSPERTTTYTMTGHGTNNCDALPLTKKVTIVPLAVPRVTFTPEFIDSDNPTVTLRDASTNSVRSQWLFNGSELVEGREITHTFEEAMSTDTVYAVLTAYNELGCPITHRFGVPVNLFTAWLPNVFTPGSEDDNSRLRLYTINHYEEFHIRIFNRRGEMVWESEDRNFEWDGKDLNGNDLPQAAYVYIINYRKPGTTTLNTLNGTITLVR